MVRLSGKRVTWLLEIVKPRTGSPDSLLQVLSLPPSVPFGDLLPACQAAWALLESSERYRTMEGPQ